MKLSQGLLLILDKTYQPSALVNMKFKGKDVLFKTDDDGNPVVLFIGSRRRMEESKANDMCVLFAMKKAPV